MFWKMTKHRSLNPFSKPNYFCVRFIFAIFERNKQLQKYIAAKMLGQMETSLMIYPITNFHQNMQIITYLCQSGHYANYR